MSNITKTTFNYDGDPEFLVKDGWYLDIGPEPFYVSKISHDPVTGIDFEIRLYKQNNEPAEPEHCDCEAGDHEETGKAETQRTQTAVHNSLPRNP